MMIRVGFVALLYAVLPFFVFGQSVSWSAGVVYEYDGSGNVSKIGTDTYVYDTAQRLIRGSVAGSQQSYTYDSFGNRKTCQPGGGGDCQYGFTVDSSTNRVEGRLYDKRGNMLQLPEGNTLEYDELGMIRKENGDGRTVYYIYTADDERIAVYEADTKLGTTNGTGRCAVSTRSRCGSSRARVCQGPPASSGRRITSGATARCSPPVNDHPIFPRGDHVKIPPLLG
jgi:hypothetical protein